MQRAARDELAEILLRSGKITAAQLEHAATEQKRHGGELGPYLVALGFISEETLVRALSARFKLPAVNIDPDRIDPATARRLPERFCRQNNVVCIGENARAKVIDVALEYPSEAVVAEARVLAGCNVRCNLATRGSIAGALRSLFGGEGDEQLDLSPDSPLRNDPHAMRAKQAEDAGDPEPQASSPVSAAQPAPRPVQAPAPLSSAAARVAPQSNQARALQGMSAGGAAERAHAPKSAGAGESLFHITMDIPPMEQQKGPPGVEDRLVRLEQIAEQNGRILEWLVTALVDSGILKQDEVEMMLGRF